MSKREKDDAMAAVEKRRIAIIGDSITAGYCGNANPEAPVEFYPAESTWTAYLGWLLGDGYDVMVRATVGLTSVYDDKFVPGRNGRAFLECFLAEHHLPIDLMIFQLCTNDLN